jgi:lambda family phage tail tape measure protein
MASSNIARLGIVFGVDTAELEVKISKAKEQFGSFAKQIERDSNSAAKDLVALRHATEDYGKTLTKVEQIEREIKAGRYQRAEGSLIEMLRKEAAAYDAKANAMKNAAGAQFKMNEQQKIQLTYQTTDLFTQIASGQSPFIAILQQGGQLKDVMGGIGPMFKAIGTLFTPFSVGMTTAAVAVGSLSYALYKAIDDLDKFKDAMTLTGGFAGVTYDKLLNLGNVLSDKTNASIGDARDLMQQLAASGKFTTTSMEAVGEVILRFAKIAGVDAKKAAETLIPLLDGTASSAKQLNDKYHFLTLEQYKNIEALEKQGRLQESAKMQATLLNESLASTQRQLGNLELAWQSLANFASKAWDAMMGWGRESGTERAKELEKLINETTLEVQRRQSKGLKTGSQEAALAAFRTELNDIVSREMAALDAAEAKAKKAEENQKKIKAYSGAGGLTKEIEIQSAIDKAIANNKYLKAVEISNEIQKIELEAAKEIREKNLEFDKKSSEEKRAFGGLLAKQLSEEIYTIELKRDEKLRAIRIKQAQADFNTMESWKEQNRADLMVETKRTEALEKTARDQTRNMEFQRDSLQLKYQLIYATEREQKLAQISLEYARRRREVEGQNPEVLKEIDRQEAMAQMFVVMEESAKRTQQVFDSVFGNLTSAIDNFVKTGKLNFKDLARSIIQDLIAIQMRAATLTFLRGMFGSFGGTGSTYNASGGMAEHVFNPSAYTGKAAGGSVTNNTPYVVGERGPEVFVPSGSGTIIPNGQLGSMGGTTNVTNYNINAIDTKSFEDRIFGSSNAIWAANQYANKQLPSNGRRA